LTLREKSLRELLDAYNSEDWEAMMDELCGEAWRIAWNSYGQPLDYDE
jgi:hypothetical protein